MPKVYESFKTKEFIHEDDAYEHALQQVKKDKQLQLEFVDWFFSGDYITHKLSEKEAENLIIFGEMTEKVI